MENNKHYGNFWNAAAKTYDIAWDKLPAGSVRKVSPSDKAVKKGMAFYVLNQPIHVDGVQVKYYMGLQF